MIIKSLLPLLLLSLIAQAQGKTPKIQYPSWYEGGEPKYQSESPLPKGWPKPGPFFQVVKKKYPTYRMAVTDGSMSSLTFMRLFKHINKQQISMTAPVEMSIKDDGDSIKMENMAFVYRDQSIANTSDNKKVNVVDIPKETYLSYAWQGCDCNDKQKSVKKALQLHAQVMGIELYDFRVLGYNGPGVPDENKTWEMQAKMK